MGAELVKPRNGLPFPEESAKAGLELAATIGIKPAARELGVSTTTIYSWQRRYPSYWSDLRAGEAAAFKQGFATRLEDLADRYAETEQDALDKVDKLLESGALGAKDVAALIKAMGSSRGVATVGARAVRGEDKAQELNINFPQLEAAMEQLLNNAPPAQRAIDIPEADVIKD